MTLDDVIDRIKKAYATRVAAIKTSTEGVRNAVNSYEVSAQEDALAQFLVTSGLLSARTEKKAEAAALDLLEAVENLPELRPREIIELADEIEEVDAPEPAEESVAPAPEIEKFPLLKRDGRVVLIFGGFVVEEKLTSVSKRSGVPLGWVSNERGGNGDSECASVCHRIRKGEYCGLIVLNELMSHRQSEMLIKAAKAAGIHHAIGKKGGTAALMSALSLFEQQRHDAGGKE